MRLSSGNHCARTTFLSVWKNDTCCTLSLVCETTSFINMQPGPAGSVCSPCHPVVLICFVLFWQVSIRSHVESVHPVRLEPTQTIQTLKTPAISAMGTVNQVNKPWIFFFNTDVSDDIWFWSKTENLTVTSEMTLCCDWKPWDLVLVFLAVFHQKVIQMCTSTSDLRCACEVGYRCTEFVRFSDNCKKCDKIQESIGIPQPWQTLSKHTDRWLGQVLTSRGSNYRTSIRSPVSELWICKS